MEAFFVLFKALIALAEKIDPILGAALKVCCERMEQWYQGDMEEIKFLHERKEAQAGEIANLRKQINSLEKELMSVAQESRLSKEVLWYVGVPVCWMVEHKLEAMSVLRMVNSWGLREAKDHLEQQIGTAGGFLFPDNLNTAQMLRAVKELDKLNVKVELKPYIKKL